MRVFYFAAPSKGDETISHFVFAVDSIDTVARTRSYG
jgi:hypothetical protein